MATLQRAVRGALRGANVYIFFKMRGCSVLSWGKRTALGRAHATNIHRFGLCTERQDESNVFFPLLRVRNVQEDGLAKA